MVSGESSIEIKLKKHNHHEQLTKVKLKDSRTEIERMIIVVELVERQLDPYESTQILGCPRG